MLLPIDCLSIALDAHMLSHTGQPGPRSMAAKRAPHGRKLCPELGGDREVEDREVTEVEGRGPYEGECLVGIG